MIIPDESIKTVIFEIPLPITQCAIQSSGTSLGGNEALVLELFLENGQKYEHEGHLSFSDAKINYISGALTFKVQLPNPHAVLVAGMKVLCNLRNDKTASFTVSTETH